MPKPQKRKVGRPSVYTEALAERICELIATTTRGLDHICASDDGLPSPRTIHYWLDTRPEFLQNVTRARERRADLIFDEMLDIADDGTRDTKFVGEDDKEVLDAEWVARSRLRVDTRKWIAARLAPKKYGEKFDVAHTGDVAVSHYVVDAANLAPEHRNALRQALKAAKADQPDDDEEYVTAAE